MLLLMKLDASQKMVPKVFQKENSTICWALHWVQVAQKFQKSQKRRGIELQEANSLVRACMTTKPCENQKLNSVMSRGGLSFIKPQFQKILVMTERYLRRKTEVSYLREIGIKKITYDLVSFKYIR